MTRFKIFILFTLLSFNGFTAELLKDKDFWVLEDTTGTLSLESIINSNVEWKHTPERAENPESVYWIKIPFSYTSTKRVLEVITSQTEHVTFYRPDLNNGYSKIKTGHLLPYETREYPHKNFVFNLNTFQTKKPYFLKIQSSNPVGFLFKLQTNTEFSTYSTKEYLLLGFYYGSLCLLALYHLIVFVILRKKVYLFYVFSVISAGLISCSDDGLGSIYIWQNFLSLSKAIGVYILPVIYLLSFSSYSISFLDNAFPKGKKIITISAISYVVIFLVQSLFIDQSVYFPKLYSIPFIIIYCVFLGAYIQQKHRAALFFLIGFTFSLFGILINQLRLVGVLEGNILTVYAFNIGVMLEFLSLALSISYKFKEEQLKKEKAQSAELRSLNELNHAQNLMYEAIKEKESVTKEINKTLEVKVHERTSQLNDLIKKLKSMNFDYDKENWELKRNVRNEKAKKLFGEKLTLEELKLLFPNNYKCLEYLNQQKWINKEFSCTKCGYGKYSENNKTFVRKCSRCSSSISPTKNSVFHAQKIQLNTLFYITYLWYNSEKLNVKNLSIELNLSEISLYNFLKKLKERKLQKLKENQPVSSWTDIIF